MKKNTLLIMLLSCYVVLHSQQLSLVKDINPGFGESFSSTRASISNGNIAYFSARTDSHGEELWVSDGTTSGTRMVKDINSGSKSSLPTALFFSGNFLYFIATDGIHGKELWKTDGTDSGTQIVKDIVPGSADAGINVAFYGGGTFATINNKLYFHTNSGLWESDGTADGTKLFFPSTESFSIVAFNNKIFFVANGKLYCSDGTIAGTINLDSGIIRDLNSSTLGIFYTNDNKLNITDGTIAGTKFVKNIDGLIALRTTAELNNKFYFSAKEGSSYKIWQTDGTPTGTTPLKSNGVALEGNFKYVTKIGNYIYFSFGDLNSNPIEFWRTDGTSSGTIKLTSFNDTFSNSIGNDKEIINFKGKAFLVSKTLNTKKTEIWSSDGTVAGTKSEVLLTEFITLLTTGLLPLKDKIIFIGRVDINIGVGEELWGYTPDFINEMKGTLNVSGKIKCYGDKTVNLEVKMSEGTPPFSYTWNSPNFVGANIDGVGYGVYSVTVEDSKGLKSKFSTYIESPNEFYARANSEPTSAEKDNGKIVLSLFNGLKPFTYKWQYSSLLTDSLANNLAKGTYGYSVTDANGCIYSDSAAISQLLPLTLTIDKPEIACKGNKVLLTAIVRGGKTNYNYIWSDNSQYDNIIVGAGKYSVTVTDSKGIIKIDSVTVTEPETKLVVTTSSTDETSGLKNGTATVLPSGGDAPYTYRWSTTPLQFQQTAINLAAGNYKVTVTDKNKCRVYSNVTVSSISSTNELGLEYGFKLYPNPTHNSLYFEVSNLNSDGKNVEILDILGRKRLTYLINSTERQYIDISSLEEGIYFFYILLGEKMLSSSFIVKR